MNPIIFIEPNLRGSRLQIFSWTAQALIKEDPTVKIVLITRDDWETPHYHEMLGDNQANICVETIGDTLGGEWIKTLDTDELSRVLAATHTAIGKHHPEICIFMALDDYLRSSAIHAGKIRLLRKSTDIFFVKYRVEYLLQGKTGFGAMKTRLRNTALALVTRFVIRSGQGRLVCFDERMAGNYIGGQPVSLLPDPWVGEFSPSIRSDGRQMFGLTDQDFVLLALGRQDKRKGIDLITASFSEIRSKIPTAKLLVVGKVDELYREAFLSMHTENQESVIHVDQFVPELDLPKYFASADVFLMPYSESFTSTSGTLPRASASGVPVVASHHGLVGYRVNQFGLGETFTTGARASFIAAIERVRNYSDDSRQKFSKMAALFSSKCSQAAFERRVSEIISYSKENSRVTTC